jgi:hypothetical protein
LLLPRFRATRSASHLKVVADRAQRHDHGIDGHGVQYHQQSGEKYEFSYPQPFGVGSEGGWRGDVALDFGHEQPLLFGVFEKRLRSSRTHRSGVGIVVIQPSVLPIFQFVQRYNLRSSRIENPNDETSD